MPPQGNYDYLAHQHGLAILAYHPRYLPAILAGMEKYDVMIGSRYVPGGGTRNWPLSHGNS